ncbi:hypothetical protein EB118_02275 [bacterium]|nr:hypothetical protein [bacterium]NBX98436.1 hypothetical protein [bacterium]NDC94122.1 hypothetical protein [bacterium]NDD83337.1 hypothetical protein [bacterium]NDG28915.1 hypothetical protein [bacterium]
MVQAPEIWGGEITDVIRDVTLSRGVVSPRVAWQASRTAMRYAFEADFLPFAETIQLLNDSSRLVRIGTYSPLEYSDTQGTIIGNPREISRSLSFVTALKALHRSVGSDFSEATFAGVMVDLENASRDLHSDFGDYSRSFIQLAGQRRIGFIDTTVTGFRNAFATIVLNPGDVYSMRFREDESTIYHAIDYIGEPYSVGVYINHDAE